MKRYRKTLPTTVLLVLFGLGCGVKTDPLPPLKPGEELPPKRHWGRPQRPDTERAEKKEDAKK